MKTIYKFKLKARIANGEATSASEEAWTFSRAVAQDWVAKAANRGNQPLHNILTEALQKPWKKMTITIRK